MTSRRGFLAGMGLGAFGFGLSGRAQAHGWGRRRGHCPPACYPAACDSPNLCPACRRGCYAMCIYACPQYLYSYSNGVWYYYCICCGSNTGLIVPCGTPLTQLNVPCSTPDYCFSLPNGGFVDQPIETSGDPSLADGIDVVIRPWIKTPKTGALVVLPFAADPYINATNFTPKTGQQQDDDIRGSTNGGLATVNSQSFSVKYGNWIVNLYDLTYTDPQTSAVYNLHIGYEVTDTSGSGQAVASVYDWSQPSRVQMPHYHQVWLKEPTMNKGYHVLVKTP